jgi:hypothetical protein
VAKLDSSKVTMYKELCACVCSHFDCNLLNIHGNERQSFTTSLPGLKMSETSGMCRSVMPCVHFATSTHFIYFV